MANKKKRCLFCKDYYIAEEGVKTPAGFFCSLDHAIKHSRSVQERQRKRQQERKAKEQRKKEQQIQEHALNEAQRLATILVHEFGIARVTLIGPLTYGKFEEGMALELFLEGIPEGAYARASGHLHQISPYDVELIDIQDLDSWTKRSIGQKGKILASK